MKKKNENNVNPAPEEAVQEPVSAEAAQPEGETEPQEAAAEANPQGEATVEQWQAALETAVRQRDEYKDSLMRSQADFMNFKRRNQTARSDGYEDGVRMTLTSLTDGLKRFGFEEMQALGEMFDPELHNAVMRESGDEPGKVLEVFQKGYRVKGKIIRYAMVKVCAE